MAEPAKSGLTHLNDKGEAHMVDVGDKPATRRRAVAGASLTATPEAVAALMGGTLNKGDALATARIAGIMAAKKTADLIPLCHPLALSTVEIGIVRETDTRIALTASVETTGPTGVEMEALTAVSIAALTLYDMMKALDKGMVIGDIRLVEKTGGRSGSYRRG
ncbi:MAG: cyclic pyranopterin monophosphate synthase MoaC [Alphaproteobacteria bacterium]|nr:cyclic pyranopterin monophosphate synthase MoaC [Alphaproteobacteria bacterium]